MKSRSVFILMSLLIASVYTIKAQDQEEDKLYARAGFKLGINYSNIVGDLEATDARVRAHLGAVVEFPVYRQFFMQAEILYSAQGYKVVEEGIENKISLNYLMLPIVGKFYVTDNISVEMGAQFATLSTVTNSKNDTSKEFFNSFSSLDYSGVIGVGYRLESGLFFQARYNLGLNNIHDNDVDMSNKNSIAQLSIGYLFKTKNNRRQQEEE